MCVSTDEEDTCWNEECYTDRRPAQLVALVVDFNSQDLRTYIYYIVDVYYVTLRMYNTDCTQTLTMSFTGHNKSLNCIGVYLVGGRSKRDVSVATLRRGEIRTDVNRMHVETSCCRALYCLIRATMASCDANPFYGDLIDEEKSYCQQHLRITSNKPLQL